MSKKGKLTLIYSCFFYYPCWLGARQKPATSGSSAVKLSMNEGKESVCRTCLACHQADGGGVQKYESTVIKTKWVLGDKNALITVVLKGMNRNWRSMAIRIIM